MSVNNTNYGTGSLNKNSGINNSAFGAYAAYNNLDTNNNTAVGSNSLFFNTTGSNNTSVGAGSLCNNDIGSLNTAIGSSAMEGLIANQSVGNLNVAVGSQSLYSNTGNLNTGVGSYSARDIIYGSYNTFLGANTTYNNTSSYYEYSTAIGYGAAIDADKQIMMGVTDTNVVIPGSAQLQNYKPTSYNNLSIVPKEYIDTIASGLKPSYACVCATTASINSGGVPSGSPSTSYTDGVIISNGDYVLVINQGGPDNTETSNVNNGLWIVNLSGEWSRPATGNMSNGYDAIGSFSSILSGAIYGSKSLVQINDPGIVGINPLQYTILNNTQTIIAGRGLSISNDVISVDSSLNFVNYLDNYAGPNSGTLNIGTNTTNTIIGYTKPVIMQSGVTGPTGSFNYVKVNQYIQFSDGSRQYTAGGGTGGGDSNWSTSGTNIYNSNSGNVGIGTNTPTYKLDVKGNMNVSGVANLAALGVTGPSKLFGPVGINKFPSIAYQFDVSGNANVRNTLTSYAMKLTTTDPATYSEPNSVVPKSYVDAIASGINLKASCNCATTINYSSWVYNGTSAFTNVNVDTSLTIDGYNVLTGDRVLVKNQVNQISNGIYVYSSSGSGTLTRSSDLPYGSSAKGVATFISYGTINSKTTFLQTNYNETTGQAITGVIELTFEFYNSVDFSIGPTLIFENNVLNVNPNLDLTTLTTSSDAEVQGNMGIFGNAIVIGDVILNGSNNYIEFSDGTRQYTAAAGSTGGNSNWNNNGLNIYNSNSGNVGIGTSTPAYKLDVDGNANVSNTFTSYAMKLTTTDPASYSDPNSVVPKKYVDSVASGIYLKSPCDCATTINYNSWVYNDTEFSNVNVEGGLTIDGYVVFTGDRVLVKDQDNQISNGIYVYDSSDTGYLIRATDLLYGSNARGVATFIKYGTTNSKTTFLQINYNESTGQAITGVIELIFEIYYSVDFVVGPGLEYVNNTLFVDPNLNLTTLTTTGDVEVGGDVLIQGNTSVIGDIILDGFNNYIEFSDGTRQYTAATGSTGGNSYWNNNGLNIYNSNSGNVGIGTSTPAYKLDVSGNANVSNTFTSYAMKLNTTNPASYSSPNSVVPKAYVDSIASGINVKASCTCATTDASAIPVNQYTWTANYDGSSNFTSVGTNLQIDGYSLANNDRVLVRINTSTDISYNGIYVYNNTSPGTLTRSADLLYGSNAKGVATFINYGNTNANKTFLQINYNVITGLAITGITYLDFTPYNSVDFVVGPGLEYEDNTLFVNPNLNLTTLTTSSNVSVGGTLNVSGLITAPNGITGATGSFTYLNIGNNIRFPDNTIQTTASANNLWGITGTNIYNTNSGNVGIGTSAPRVPLELYADQIIYASNIWTSRTPAANNSWQSICYGNGLFIAVSTDGPTDNSGNRIMTSQDGINWTIRKAAENNSWQSVCYGNGLFVAVSNSGTYRVMTSIDGIKWTSRTAGTDISNSWSSVCYGDGLFVAVSTTGNLSFTNRIIYSYDGINWTNTNVPAISTASWQSVCYGNGKYVAVNSGGDLNPIYSNDGITWYNANITEYIQWQSVCYGNGLFVAVSKSGTNRVMTSPDGINWTSRSAATNISWESICYGNGLFVAISSSGSGNRVMTSTNGINWYTRTSAQDYQWQSVCYGNGLFVAVSSNGISSRVMTSGKQYQNIETSVVPWVESGNNIRATLPGTCYASVFEASAFVTTSDYRIKENVKNLDETFSIDDLRPVTYFNKKLEKYDMGFIAHEVQKIFPFLVNGEKDDAELQSLNYNGFIALLVKEIQGLKQENKLLKSKIEEIKEMI